MTLKNVSLPKTKISKLKNGPHILFLVTNGHKLQNAVVKQCMDFLIDIFILPGPYWGHAFNPKNATQTHSIFVKL